ncbi:ABC transporter permease subunit [Rhizobium oryzihabitans]|jgi:sn-glycerol 3-phosphate transport system permease protein|uniref:sn-glycerol-3-phosphate transport system permease protein UgpE n=1 Tax=Rhizobium oryzihabitans TaxID=2267833 RepID=A0A7L5BLS9_9HYPH|nr:ABC transporter permease subunit [Rhizobium oryzihabitans]EGP54935.1 sn-glycerol-3-phosphate ABC transporter membrane protein [Agrobacterium tumefaciens F2]QCM06652.1 ABC transporter permease subunit [Agrobacterium tumefaciens]QIB39676.1 ABC transporter permease subunit [Rhizobium oryzihabitans]CUX50621.1 Putative sugar ABC transporter (permease protein); putative glycerol 3-phosphate transport protein, ugpE-like protein [Agrobacterium genomosp. 5 str. CFBP 6626]
MIQRTPFADALTYVLMVAGFFLLIGPFIVVISGASQSVQQVNSVPFSFMPQGELFTNAATAWERANLGNALLNSMIMATLVTIGKVALSACTAFAIVFFRSPLKHFFFWTVFITLMLPLEVRVVPTYSVAADLFQPFRSILGLFGIEVSVEWNLLNSYSGLTLPLVATATGTFLYRQFFMTIPDELAEAARMDGSGPVRFFVEMLLPLSRTNMAALTTIMFVYAWNQYLWPLLMITDPSYKTVMMSLRALLPAEDGIPDWNVTLAGSLIIILPPLLVVAFLQRWFVRGLVSSDK